MPRIPEHLAGCALVGAIALGTAYGWLAWAGQDALSVPAIVACTLISVAVALAVEAVARRVRRGRPRRAHARMPRPFARSANPHVNPTSKEQHDQNR